MSSLRKTREDATTNKLNNKENRFLVIKNKLVKKHNVKSHEIVKHNTDNKSNPCRVEIIFIAEKSS